MLLKFPLITALAAASVHSQENSQSPLIVINVGCLSKRNLRILSAYLASLLARAIAEMLRRWFLVPRTGRSDP